MRATFFCTPPPICTVLASELALRHPFAPRLMSRLALRHPFTPFWRQNAVDTTLGKKWQRWIVLKRTAIVAIFC